jgi:hypothetical protein
VRFGEYGMDELAELLLDVEFNWPFWGAAHLVCEEGTWLSKPDFYRFLLTGEVNGRQWVGIDWAAVVRELDAETIEGSQEELFILKLGASMTRNRSVRFMTELGNLSDKALFAVMRSIAYMQGMEDAESTSAARFRNHASNCSPQAYCAPDDDACKA